MTINWKTPLAELQAAISGVGSLSVVSGGSGYTSIPTVIIGDPAYGGTRATATPVMGVGSIVVPSFVTIHLSFLLIDPPPSGVTATGTVNVSPTRLGAITVAYPGSGYSSAPEITISGGGGTGATAQAIVSGGSIVAVVITSGGYGYTSPPSVTTTGSATFSCTLAESVITSFTITDPGSGYITPPSATISTLLGVIGKTTTTMQVVGFSGCPDGYGYTSAPTVAITNTDGNGSGASAYSNLVPAVVNADEYSINASIQVANELRSVGEAYDSGMNVSVTETFGGPVWVVPTSVNWSEVDKATRYAMSVSTGWYHWSWETPPMPSSDPNTVMLNRAIPFVLALSAHSGTVDPFIGEIFIPLFELARPAFGYYLTTQRIRQPTGVTIAYADDSSLAVHLNDLIATATEMTSYLLAV